MPNDVEKTSRCDDAEVQAIMEAGTESVGWVREDLCSVNLADERLNRRPIKAAKLLGKSLHDLSEAQLTDCYGMMCDAQNADHESVISISRTCSP